MHVLPSPLSQLGEGPHWDIETQNLYYVDIFLGSVLRYDYAANKTFVAKVGKYFAFFNATCSDSFFSTLNDSSFFFIENENLVSFITPIAGKKNEFVIGMSRRIGIIKWNGIAPIAKVIRVVAEVERDPKYARNRFNDGKADPFGRIYAGTMRYEECVDLPEISEGTLYRFSKEDPGGVPLLNNIAVSNGVAWNIFTEKYYYIDTCACSIREFDYDLWTGNICKHFFNF